MNNDLKVLPKYMGDLRKLEFLYLQHNDIKELPDIEGCKQLQELHISNNFIKVISVEWITIIADEFLANKKLNLVFFALVIFDSTAKIDVHDLCSRRFHI